MARQATYFVRVDSYWQNSPDRFVGPFSSREDAQAAIDAIQTEDNGWLSTSTCGGDIRDAVRVYPSILSKTQARATGMRDYAYGDMSSNLIGERIPRSVSEMRTVEEFGVEELA